MDRLLRIEPPEVSSIVRDESEIFFENTWHQPPIGFTAQTKPIDMSCFVTMSLCNSDEGCVQALVDEEFHLSTQAFVLIGGSGSANSASPALST